MPPSLGHDVVTDTAVHYVYIQSGLVKGLVPDRGGIDSLQN